MTCWTLTRVWSLTRELSLRTLETVPTPTPAARATSWIVANSPPDGSFGAWKGFQASGLRLPEPVGSCARTRQETHQVPSSPSATNSTLAMVDGAVVVAVVTVDEGATVDPGASVATDPSSSPQAIRPPVIRIRASNKRQRMSPPLLQPPQPCRIESRGARPQVPNHWTHRPIVSSCSTSPICI